MKLDKMYQPTSKEEINVPPSDISIQRLIDDGLLILFREIYNLKMMSVKGKLSAPDARDLRDHLKLLFELKTREDDMLKGLTDEELERKVKEELINNDNIKD